MDFHVVTGGEGPAVLFVHAGVADSRNDRPAVVIDNPHLPSREQPDAFNRPLRHFLRR